MLLDPVKLAEEIVVSIVAVVLLSFLWVKRRRVLMLLTGDDRLHGTSLDLAWWGVFRCCGNCTGEWTRMFTNWPCCPKRFYRANLVKSLGQTLGFATYSVEIKNIVVGDLPYGGRGDFYLSVECSQNPPMMTSVQEEMLPKVVHFPEIITTKVKFSYLEEKVRISVKELSVLGSTELCAVHISAMQILSWAFDDDERTKRFEMKPTEVADGLELETPPWILLEFDHPDESHQYDQYLGDTSTVRTGTQRGGAGGYGDITMLDFKHQYGLIDSSGNAVEERSEEELIDIASYRKLFTRVVTSFNVLVFLLLCLYAAFRHYVGACYVQYRWLAMAVLSHRTFPMSTANLKDVVSTCHDLVSGTGLASGVPCRPSANQTIGVCMAPPLNQPTPSAFTGWVEYWFGLEVRGVPCHSEVCPLRAHVVEWDRCMIVATIGLLASVFLLRWYAKSAIRRRKRDVQLRKIKQMKTVRETFHRTAFGA